MNWSLVTESGELAVEGAEYLTFRGEKVILTGGRPPHKEGSSGKVYLQEGTSTREYYPSVINLKWVSQ